MNIFISSKTRLLNLLSAAGKGVSRSQKPGKIFLENTNLAYAINPNPDKGNIRETFLLNQLINTAADVYAPATGDFITSGLTIEVGERAKTTGQVKNAENLMVAADDIETGYGARAPLWLFGFLY